MHLGGGGFTNVGLKAGTASSFKDETVGKIVQLKGGAVRQVGEIVAGKFAMHVRPGVRLNTLSEQGVSRVFIKVGVRAAVGKIGRIGFTTVV